MVCLRGGELDESGRLANGSKPVCFVLEKQTRLAETLFLQVKYVIEKTDMYASCFFKPTYGDLTLGLGGS